MSILISGSIAFDTIIHTVGSFRENDINTKQDDMHLSLFSPRIEKEYGGTGANIAYSLVLLGESPYLIGTYGDDASDYIAHMERIGIDTHLCEKRKGSYSAQAFILRDENNGQINTFHAGAMSDSGNLTHKKEKFTHAIVAPDSKEGMVRRVDECVEDGIFTIFDPGQAMGIFSHDELLHAVKKSHLTVMNESERKQYEAMTGKDFIDICREYNKIGIVTLAERGSCIFEKDKEILIPGIPAETITDQTGCGDAYRAGLLYGLSQGWTLEKSAKIGSIIASIKIRHFGGQNHHLSKDEINSLGQKYLDEIFFA